MKICFFNITIIVFCLTIITTAFPNLQNEENYLNYQTRNIHWCKKFCKLNSNYDKNKISNSLIKWKCKICYKLNHSTTSLAPNTITQKNAVTSTTTIKTTSATSATTTTTTTTTTTPKSTMKPTTSTTTVTSTTPKSIVTKSTIEQNNVTSSTPIVTISQSTTLPTTTTTTTTIDIIQLNKTIENNLMKAKARINYIMETAKHLVNIKNKIIEHKDELEHIEIEIKLNDSIPLADLKLSGMKSKEYIIKELAEVEKAKKYVSNVEKDVKKYLNEAKKDAKKINFDISAEINNQTNSFNEGLKNIENEHKICNDEAEKAINIYNNIEKFV